MFCSDMAKLKTCDVFPICRKHIVNQIDAKNCQKIFTGCTLDFSWFAKSNANLFNSKFGVILVVEVVFPYPVQIRSFFGRELFLFITVFNRGSVKEFQIEPSYHGKGIDTC